MKAREVVDNKKKVIVNGLSGDIGYIPSKLFQGKQKSLFGAVFSAIARTKKDELKRYEYLVNGNKWLVVDAPLFKIARNLTDCSYNCFFSKETGLNIRFGKELEDDPAYCELGPEILDLEIVVNGCLPVKGSENCKYCYKCNTNAAPVSMTFETFKHIVDSFPKNLSQIAFGITSLHANPDMPKMFEYCREVGITPNLTTVGVDLDDEMRDLLCSKAGAVAVSCYPGAKELCYKTIRELSSCAREKFGRSMSVNMHILLSKWNKDHLMEVLQDIADKKVEGLKSVVLLRVKPCGRAKSMDCTIPMSLYEEVVDFCMSKGISFGFDSCSATPVMEVLKKKGHDELCRCCEPCESSKLSSYINVKGEYWSCSFAERTDFIKPINVLEYESATEWWNSDEVKRVRFLKEPACKSCPIFNLDGDISR